MKPYAPFYTTILLSFHSISIQKQEERKKGHKYCITKVEAFGYIVLKVEVILYLGLSKYSKFKIE